MKNSTLLIVGVGVPSELTEVLAKAGCEVQRSDSPLTAAIALVRGDVDLVLMVGPQDESWNDFTDAAFATGKLVSVESLIAIPTALANGLGTNGNGNGNGNGNVARGHEAIGYNGAEGSPTGKCGNGKYQKGQPSRGIWGPGTDYSYMDISWTGMGDGWDHDWFKQTKKEAGLSN